MKEMIEDIVAGIFFMITVFLIICCYCLLSV